MNAEIAEDAEIGTFSALQSINFLCAPRKFSTALAGRKEGQKNWDRKMTMAGFVHFVGALTLFFCHQVFCPDLVLVAAGGRSKISATSAFQFLSNSGGPVSPFKMSAAVPICAYPRHPRFVSSFVLFV